MTLGLWIFLGWLACVVLILCVFSVGDCDEDLEERR